MTLAQALGLIQQRRKCERRRRIFLACGFQPLHLANFLQGHLAGRFPEEGSEIQTGVYGDLEGALASAAGSDAEAAAVVVEWGDLDPRLGARSAGGWAVSRQPDILEHCRQRFDRMLAAVRTLAGKIPIALVPPTLPITLLGHTAGWQASAGELDLAGQAAAFFAEAARIGGVAVLNPSDLARRSPERSRFDVLMELRAGFPYSLAHASAVAAGLVKLLYPPAPIKGLITDLDGTLWSGIVGEVGPSGVSWSLAEHTQMHGLYQQMLAHLCEMGVLVAVASKNEPAVVEETLKRGDLLAPAASIFPVLANWGPKSESVARILHAWNIAADSVVFVDDSAMELEEVRRAFPAITCLQFFEHDPVKTFALLEQLRDLFGKPTVLREDALRQASIRANAAVREAATGSGEGFLCSLQGKVIFDGRKDPGNRRMLELINKTNQFNLNGERLSEGEWMRHLSDPSAIAIGVSYEDKFGPLGAVAVVAGRQAGPTLAISTWVMSCRAFSRRIEYHTLLHLFEAFGAERISLRVRFTERNQPLRQFLKTVAAPPPDGEPWVIGREAFLAAGHDLPHAISEPEELLRQSSPR